MISQLNSFKRQPRAEICWHMHLFIVRHGEAEQHSHNDSSRNLNHNGRQESIRMGRWIAQQCEQFDLVLMSPFNRAIQTWESMQAQGIRCKQFVYLTELQPEADVETSLSVIQAYSDGLDNVLVVSHLPLVCHLVDELVVEPCPLFATGTTAVLNLSKDHIKGHLEQIISPAQVPNDIPLRA
ncbi:phosphohistidine phosphatase SixA [Catenovulum sediminis]|uniref:Phosphohistidine phosphatase SixA n=1 Tax=Catenovulum sediminis TaxID=1740262 RepID=A0ABV1RLP9_9ALTE|nr:phosphohistidine phosphatase SixA [Catenovulum sediminis]